MELVRTKLEKVIEVALSQVGYLEKKTNSQLDDFTANVGNKNYTKYARDLDSIPNFYNGKKNGYSWCDVFVDWCFVEAFGVDAAKKLLCQPDKSCGAGCEYSAQYYKNKGQFFTSAPQPGDQIFFINSSGSVCHTGLVYKVDRSYVYTVEGNTSVSACVVANGGGVCAKKYVPTNKSIYGYGRPDYLGVSYAVECTKEWCEVRLTVLRKGHVGEQVKALQRMLYAMGYALGSKNPIDGDFGSKTESAVKTYQEANGLTVDGVVGAKTWGKLLGV